MSKKLKNKAISASVNAALITSALIAPLNVANAEETEINNSFKINLINKKTGLSISPTASMNLEVYTDQSEEYIIDGNLIKNTGVLEFISKSNMSADKTYHFKITSDEFEDFEGDINFNNGNYEISLAPKPMGKSSEEELFDARQDAIRDLQKLGVTSSNDLDKIRNAESISEVNKMKTKIANSYTPVEDDGKSITLSPSDVRNMMDLIDMLDMSRQNEGVENNLIEAKELLRTSGNTLDEEDRNFIAKAFNDIDRDKLPKKQISKIDDINSIVRLLDTNKLKTSERSKPAKIHLNFYENEVGGKVPRVRANEIEFYTIDGKELNLRYDSVVKDIRSFADLDIDDSIVIKVKKDGYFDFSTKVPLSKIEQEVDLVLRKVPDLKIKAENIDATYGDNDIVLASKIEVPEDYDGNIKYSVKKGNDIIDLNGDVVTINKPGKAIISYEAPKTKNYNGASGEFQINVSKKDLGIIEFDQINWLVKEKTYDGNKYLNTTASIKKESGLIKDDEINFEANLELDDANVGKYKSTIKNTNISGLNNDYYNFTISDVGPEVKINPLDVNLNLNPLTTKYGSEEWEQIKKNQLPKNYNLKELYNLESEISDELKEEFNSLDLSKNISFDFSKNKYNVGSYKDSYNVNVLNKAIGNFNINFDNIYGDINIEASSYEKDEILNNVTFDKDNSTNVVEKNDKIYASPGSVIAYKIKDTSLYDKLNIRPTNLNQEDFEANKITVPAEKKDGNILVDLFLSRSDSEETKTNVVSMPKDIIEIDSEAPKVSFEDGLLTYGIFNRKEKVEFTNESELLTFTKKHSKEGYTIKTDIKDEQSGIKEQKYSLVKVKSDKEASDILKNIYTNDSMSWKELPKNGEIKVHGSDDGYYMVLVKASDNLGNETIYASNGIAIDITSPKIVIKGIEDKIHNENVAYSIDITDSIRDKAYTGIKNVIVNVYDGDKLLKSHKKNTNSFELSQKDLFKGKYVGDIDSFDEFGELSHISNIEGLIDADSNDIKIEVIAEDQVGNKIAEKTVNSIVIDKNKAAVNAHFDNNDSKNGKYFNKDRVLNLEIGKRNYNEDNLQFNISINGKKGQYSIDDIRNGLVEGVEIISDRKDSQKDLPKELLTNSRTNSYQILFGSKNEKTSIEYDLEIIYKDYKEDVKAFFPRQDKNVDHFVIDEIPPVIDIEYFNESNGKELVGDNKKKPFYTQGTIKPRLIIKERNFDKKDVSVSVSSYDAKGNNEGKYELKNLNKVNQEEWTKKDNDLNIFDLVKFVEDSNYSLSMEYEDLAGNKAELYKPHYFTIDKTNPTAAMKAYYNGKEEDYTRILNEAESRGAIKNYIYNIFGQNDIRFKTEYDDLTSGIESVKYYVENINKEEGNSYDSIEDLRNLNWISKNEFEDIVVRADKAGVVYQKIEDKAGNITYISSDGAFIRDSRSPNKPIIDIKDIKEKNIFNKNITFRIKATDPDNGGRGVYSGIKNVSYEVRDKDTNSITQKGVFPTKKDERVRTLEEEIQIDSLKSNSNNLELKVIAEDRSGNKEVSIKNFSIDSTAPTIESNLDTSNERNGKYYNTSRNVSIEIKERNFSEKATTLILDVNGKTKKFTFSDIRNGAAKDYGIELANVKDSEANKILKTDNRLITYNMLFGVGNNIDYEYSNIRFMTVDEAGNESSIDKSIKDFVVDNIRPTIDVSYYNGSDVTNLVTTNRNLPLYSQTGVSPTITIKDNRFNKGNVASYLEQFNLKTNNLNNYTNMSSIKTDKWRVNGDTYSYTLPSFEKDGIYGLSLEYEDLAGNKAQVYNSRYFAIDKTAPEGSIDLYEDGNKYSYRSLTDGASFTHKSKSGISVDKTVTDDVSGIASVSYYIYKPETHTQGDFKALSLNELRRVNWTNWDSLINVNFDQQFVIYQRIIDRAGNIRYINTQGASIVDKTAPFNPEISISAPESNKNIYDKSVPVSVSVKDKIVNNSYSGLKKATIEVYNNGVKTQSQEYSISNIKYRKSEFASSITVDANKNNSNNVMVRVIVEDNVGNVASSEKTISIDITPPKVEVIYDVDASANKKYFNKGRVATIRVYERNFDPNLFNLNIKGGRVNVGRWSIGSKAGISDENVNTLRIEFLEDGEYDFTFDLADKAGNKTKYGKIDNFIVDKTKPTISLSFDKSLVNGKYINSKRVGTITIKEKNFDPKGFESQLFARLNGSTIASPAISGWSSNGDVHTATIVFSKDGDYSGVFNYTDLAGNKADEVKIEEFTVDTQAPKITFEKIKNGHSYKDEIKPEIVFEDINYNKDSTEIRLVGKKHKEIKINGAYISEGNNKGRVILNNFPIEKDIDDVYTLIVSNVDKAGNKTEEKIHFSVNRYGSNYYFSKNTEKYLKVFYNNKQRDIEIFEVNPDELTDQNVIITRNGSKVELKPGDFFIKKIDANGWNEYKYVINNKVFENEGVYEITIDSKDKAGNIQSNKIKERPIKFIVDKTKPGGVITGIENNTVYNDISRLITIKAEDDHRLKSINLYIDGELIKTYSQKEIDDNNGSLTYNLKEKESWQKVKVIMEDAAGNISETEEVKVLITSNTFTRLINNKKIVYGSIGSLLALLLLIFAIIKRRNEDEEEE